MMSLDMKTVVFIYLIINVIVTLVLVPVWLQNRKRFDGIGWWLTDYFLQTIGLFFVFIGNATNNLYAIALGSPLAVAGILVMFLGLGLFVGKKLNQLHNYILFAVFFSVHLYYTFIEPNLSVRTINIFSLSLLYSIQIFYLMIFRVDKEIRQITRNTGLVFLAFIFLFSFRIMDTIMKDHGNDFFKSGGIPALLLLANSMLVFLLTFSLISMINSLLLRQAAENASEKEGLLTNLSREVGERRQAESELLEAKESLELVFNTSPDSTLITRLHDGLIVDINNGFTAMTGFTSDETIGKSSMEIDLWKDPYDRQNVVNELKKKGSCDNYEAVFRMKDGSLINGSISARIITLHGVQHIISVTRDITERKQAEEKLRQTNEYLENLFNYANAPIIVWNPEFRITRFNQAFEKITGKKSSDVIGKPLDILFPPDRVDGSLRLIKNTTGGERWEIVEILIQNSDGSVRTVLWNSATIFDRDGKAPIATIAQGQDITDRKHAEAERLELQKQLFKAQKLQSIGILAGGMAHDFNNMLSVIMGNLELTLLGLPPDSRLRTNIKRAIETSAQVADLTSQMLAYSGQGKYVVEKISLNDMIRENILVFESSLPGGVMLQSDLDDDLPLIEADKDQVEQVIMNLILNASEAIGDKNGTITLACGKMLYNEEMLNSSVFDEKPRPGNYVFLEVADTGCGMDDATKEKMFDPFFSTKFVGRGLGLAAVHGILRNYSGDIFVQSSPGKGTKIRVLFPAMGIGKEQTPMVS
jgi:PAS domain S-box-containing protein